MAGSGVKSSTEHACGAHARRARGAGSCGARGRCRGCRVLGGRSRAESTSCETGKPHGAGTTRRQPAEHIVVMSRSCSDSDIEPTFSEMGATQPDIAAFRIASIAHPGPMPSHQRRVRPRGGHPLRARRSRTCAARVAERPTRARAAPLRLVRRPQLPPPSTQPSGGVAAMTRCGGARGRGAFQLATVTIALATLASRGACDFVVEKGTLKARRAGGSTCPPAVHVAAACVRRRGRWTGVADGG